MRRLLLVSALAIASFGAYAQSAIVRGEVSAGSYENIKSTSQALNVNLSSGTFPAAAALSDASANPTTTTIGSDNMVFNGATWDRWRGVGTGIGQVTLSNAAPAALADTAANPTTTYVGADNNLFNGTTWDRQRAATGTTGVANVSNEGTKTTYSAAIAALVPAAGATDVFCISGSPSKTVKVSRITFMASATSAAALDITLIKRAAVDTGGTSTNPTKVPLDSANAAGTATVVSYTVNPTINSTVGTIRAVRSTVLSASGNGGVGFLIWEFGVRNTQYLTLRGAAEQVCVNYGGATNAGNVADADVEWTEE